MEKSTKNLVCSIMVCFAILFAGKLSSQSAFLVKDINPGNGTSYAGNMTDINGTLFFLATDGVHGVELWKSDGTSNGTVLVKIIKSTIGSGYNGTLLNVNGILLFNALIINYGKVMVQM